MADIRISDLPVETNPENLYVVAAKQNVQGNTYTSCKYNIGSAYNAVKTVADGIAPSAADAFDATKRYYVGQLVSYTPSGASTAGMYRCVTEHSPGAWNDDHFTATSAYAELCSLTAGGYETVSVSVTGPSTLSGITVTATFFDTTLSPITATTDATGHATVAVPKEKEYVLSVSDVVGFTTPAPAHHIATLGSRPVSFAYTTTPAVESVSVTVTLDIPQEYQSLYTGKSALLMTDNWLSGCVPVFSNVVQYEVGDVVQYAQNGVGKTYRFTVQHPAGSWDASQVTEVSGNPKAILATFATSGGVTSATFVGVPANRSAIIDISAIDSTTVKPIPRKVWVGSSDLNVNLKITTLPNTGVLYVDATDFTEHADPQDILDAGHTCVALHILGGTVNASGNPLPNPNRNLIESGNDYYVLTKSLVNQTTPSAFVPQYKGIRSWSSMQSTWVFCPNVTTDVNNEAGQAATYHMINDLYSIGHKSLAAEYAISQVFNYGNGSNGKTVNGYLGTRGQWQALIDHHTQVYEALNTLGFVVSGETRIADYYTSTLWSSTQASTAANAWLFVNQGWSSGFSKSGNYTVIPFFSV